MEYMSVGIALFSLVLHVVLALRIFWHQRKTQNQPTATGNTTKDTIKEVGRADVALK